MHQHTYARQYNSVYAAACVFSLLAGFLAGIALIPDGLFRKDRFDIRTIATYFFHSENFDKNQLGSGWLAPSQDGTWSRGNRSVLLVNVDDDHKTDLELEFVLFPFFARQHRTQTVRVTVNDHEVGIWKLKAPMRRNLRTVYAKSSLWKSHQPMRIGFEYANPRSPAELGVAGGDEPLAIRLSSLVVREQR